MSSASYFPSFSKFSTACEENDIVPLCREIVADLDTPLTLFAKFAHDHDNIFLFESMEGGEKWGRYSFIGFEPLLKFISHNRDVSIEMCAENRKQTHTDANPLEILRNLIGDLDAFEDENLPRFCGGAVGFLGYDMVRFMEELPDRHDDLDFPDSSFIIPRVVLVHDSFRQTVTVVCWMLTETEDKAEKLYEDAARKIEEVIQQIRGPVPSDLYRSQENDCCEAPEFVSNMQPEMFHRMVEAAREYILAGDIFQVVLSQRFHTKTNIPPLQIYRALRHINPSPYLFFLKLDKLIQIGSSPEILVRKEGDSIELRPIAGTRKRGKDTLEDQALENELLADPKERAEHLMLVDLGRNDVGRIAEGGSVEVRDLAVIERYSHVMHIVSGVHGKIAPGKDQFDVMAACFPAGTVSGAPKIRAMEIIDELEVEKRGPYAGSVGYFGFSGNMDFCITIRTVIMQGDDLYIQAGAGIVADSDPAREFEETVNKSMGLRRAVELADKGF